LEENKEAYINIDNEAKLMYFAKKYCNLKLRKIPFLWSHYFYGYKEAFGTWISIANRHTHKQQTCSS